MLALIDSIHSTATKRVQKMIEEFASDKDVKPDMVRNLQDALNGSPTLVEQVRLAVTSPVFVSTSLGPEKHMRMERLTLETDPHAGGSYNRGNCTLSLSPTSLVTSTRDLTFLLGHEVQHSFNKERLDEANNNFVKKAIEIANGKQRPHDYTELIRQTLETHRNDEALAQIAGWNALVSRERQKNPDDCDNKTLTEKLTHMYKLSSDLSDGTNRILDFVTKEVGGKIQAKGGLEFEHDGTLKPTPTNIEREAKLYFDKPASVRITEHKGLGREGKSDYRNAYGADLVRWVIKCINRSARTGLLYMLGRISTKYLKLAVQRVLAMILNKARPMSARQRSI